MNPGELKYSGRGRRPKAIGPATHKTCPKCGIEKEVCNFALRRKGTSSYASYCKPCSSEIAVSWARANSERHNANGRRWRLENPEKCKEKREKVPVEIRRGYDRKSYWKDPEKKRLRRREHYHANKESSARKYQEWRLANPGKNAAKSMPYEARKRKAMPPWADQAAIRDVYDRCAEMNKSGVVAFQVDHIMPLSSPILCGLHVHYNLQIIPAAENMSKGNRVIL